MKLRVEQGLKPRAEQGLKPRVKLYTFSVCAALFTCSASCGAIKTSGSATPASADRPPAANESTQSVSPVVASQDERRTIGGYASVRGVALSRRYVFALSDGGIAIYDRVFNSWQRPFSMAGATRAEQVTAFAADPIEDAVWFGIPGAVYLYRPQTSGVQRSGIPGVPEVFAFDQNNPTELLARSDRQWFRVSRSGIVTPLVSGLPPSATVVGGNTLTQVYRKFPALRNQQIALFREPNGNRPLVRYDVTSGALSPDQASEAWLGTNGNGLWKINPTFLQGTALRFGLIESGAGSVATDGVGVWVGPLGTQSERAGLVYATNDFQNWRWIDGTIAVPLLGVRANDMALRGNRVWLATNRGVVQCGTDANAEMLSYTSLNGLPSDVVYAIAAQQRGVWAGTARGLVFIIDSAALPIGARPRLVSAPLLSGIAVHALQPVGDTVWVGTDEGLFAIAAGNVNRVAASDPALQRPIRALAWSDSALFVATDNELVQLNPRAAVAAVHATGINATMVGRISSMFMDEQTVVIAGTRGVLSIARPGRPGTSQFLGTGLNVAGEPLDVAMSREWVWVAATDGLMRLSRQRDGSLR